MFSAIMQVAHANRPATLKKHFFDQSTLLQHHISPFERWTQIGIRTGPATPFPDSHVGRAKTFLSVAIVIRRVDIASGHGRLNKRIMQWVVAGTTCHMQRSIVPTPACLATMRLLHTTKVGQYICIAPPGGTRFFPMCVITCIATHINHAIY